MSPPSGKTDALKSNAAEASTTPAPDSGTPSVPPSPIWYLQNADCPYFLNLNTPACGRLIRHAFAPHDLPSLIETISSSKDESDAVHSLQGDDAQIFVDVMNEARYTFAYRRESETDTNTFYRPGARLARSSATNPGEMSQIVIQDVRSPRASSEGHEGPRSVRQNQCCTVQRRVWGHMEGEPLRPRCRCEGRKDIFEQ